MPADAIDVNADWRISDGSEQPFPIRLIIGTSRDSAWQLSSLASCLTQNFYFVPIDRPISIGPPSKRRLRIMHEGTAVLEVVRRKVIIA